MIVVEIFAAWMLADFLTGLVHWAEDVFLNEETKFEFLNQIKEDNDFHHIKPTAMLFHSYWGNINTSAPFTIPLSISLYFSGAPLVLWLAVFFATFANITHRWAHTPRRQIPKIVVKIQKTGLFISPRHHNEHHFKPGGLVAKRDANKHFCPMTNYLNPILDRIGFFRRLKSFFSIFF